MRLIDNRTGLEVMDRDECLRLLASHLYSVGRLGVLDGRHPVVLPINYALDGDEVVFRTAVGTKLAAAIDRAFVSFELDDIDDGTRTGWSVLVKGRAEVVTSARDLMRLRALPLAPWADGEHLNWVVLRPEQITGRRVVGHEPFFW